MKLTDIITLAIAATPMLTACGVDDQDVLKAIPSDYADVERSFTFTLNATAPGNGDAGATRTKITDRQAFGLDICWNKDDKLAVFSNCITSDKPVKLEVMEPISASDVMDNNFASWAMFAGTGSMTAGNTVNNARANEQLFALVYPFEAFSSLAPNSSSVVLDFDRQTGDLKTLQEHFQYAWGLTSGVINGDDQSAWITPHDMIGDRCNHPDIHPGHNYDESVLLDEKMSILRFSLVHKNNDNSLISFSDYLTSIGTTLQTIMLIDDNGNIRSQASLDLYTGQVTAIENYIDYITITPKDNATSIAFTEIDPKSELSAGGKSWGSSFYVSIPVPDSKAVYDFLLMLIDSGGNYYHVAMNRRSFNEGSYYITEPLVVTSEDTTPEPYSIMTLAEFEDEYIIDDPDPDLLIWDSFSLMLLWDRYSIGFVPEYLFENVRPGAVMSVDFRLHGQASAYLQFNDGSGSHYNWHPLPGLNSVYTPHDGQTVSLATEGRVSGRDFNDTQDDKSDMNPYFESVTRIEFELTAEMLEKIRNNPASVDGRGITITGEGNGKQSIDRISIRIASSDELPDPVDYSKPLFEGRFRTSYSDYFYFNRLCKRPLYSLREGDILRIHYDDTDRNPWYNSPLLIQSGINDNPLNGIGNYGQIDLQATVGYFDIPITAEILYFFAYYNGAKIRRDTGITITRVEAIRP
ncbi:MAG: hypothetical protein KBT20_08480 [Bacteroidales bacterium]|nr:hypothetical protein [Candidatus Liminaster caballi]